MATCRCMLHSTNEPGELSQWQCHYDTTINTVMAITIITIRPRDRQTDRQTDRDRQTDTDRDTDIQTERQTDRPSSSRSSAVHRSLALNQSTAELRPHDTTTTTTNHYMFTQYNTMKYQLLRKQNTSIVSSRYI